MSVLHIRNHDRPNKAVRVYNSIEHALRVATTQRCWKKQSSQSEGDSSWYGADFETALDYAKRGWREGAVKVRQAFAKLPAPTLSAGNAWRNDYFGEQIDMARFASGEDACFRTRNGNNRGRAKLVRILVPMGFPCSTSSTAVINRGSAIISVVDALEMTRRTVEVVASFSSTSDSDREPTSGFHMNHCVVVKAAGQPFDIPRMAFFIAHTASLRRIGFALMETIKEAEPSHRNGYGYGCNIHPDEQSHTSIALPELHGGRWSSPEEARETLAEIIRKQGHQLSFRD
jgi:hypothetical protein